MISWMRASGKVSFGSPTNEGVEGLPATKTASEKAAWDAKHRPVPLQQQYADAKAMEAPAFVPPTSPGDKVYTHPQGATIVVHPDGSLNAYGKDGKKKNTSATAENLAAGHGKWTEATPGAKAPEPKNSTYNGGTSTSGKAIGTAEQAMKRQGFAIPKVASQEQRDANRKERIATASDADLAKMVDPAGTWMPPYQRDAAVEIKRRTDSIAANTAKMDQKVQATVDTMKSSPFIPGHPGYVAQSPGESRADYVARANATRTQSVDNRAKIAEKTASLKDKQAAGSGVTPAVAKKPIPEDLWDMEKMTPAERAAIYDTATPAEIKGLQEKLRASLDKMSKYGGNLGPGAKIGQDRQYGMLNEIERHQSDKRMKQRRDHPTAADVLQDLNDYDASDESPPNISLWTAQSDFGEAFNQDPKADSYMAKINGTEVSLGRKQVLALLGKPEEQTPGK